MVRNYNRKTGYFWAPDRANSWNSSLPVPKIFEMVIFPVYVLYGRGPGAQAESQKYDRVASVFRINNLA
jgi:hypothetical protein